MQCYDCKNWIRSKACTVANDSKKMAPCKILMKENLTADLEAIDKYFVYYDDVICDDFEEEQGNKSCDSKCRPRTARTDKEKKLIKARLFSLVKKGLAVAEIGRVLEVPVASLHAILAGRMYKML